METSILPRILNLDAFCRDAWIKRELTVPYNHQQNGVEESKNMSIIETTKAMIHDLDFPMFF